MANVESFYQLYESIMDLDSRVRFVTVIDSQGQMVYGGQRQGIENHLDTLDQKLSMRHALDAWRLRTQFEDQIGENKYTMAEYEKIKRYTVPLDKNHLLFITTENDVDHCSFMKNLLKLKNDLKVDL